MRGEKPVAACEFDDAGPEALEVILEAFRRFVRRELERRDEPEGKT